MTEALIFDAVRTPRGKGKRGALHSVKPVTLAAGLLRALADRNELDTSAVDDVVLGVVSPVGEQGADIARTAVLVAGWDLHPQQQLQHRPLRVGQVMPPRHRYGGHEVSVLMVFFVDEPSTGDLAVYR